MKSKGAQRVAMQHRIDMAMLGIKVKAHFDPNQPRDPHTGRWMTIGMSLSADDLGEALDAMSEMRHGAGPSPLENRLIDAHHAGGQKLSLTVDDLNEMIDALANARDAFGGSPSPLEQRLISARAKLAKVQKERGEGPKP